jgi:membrane protease YdiL (CAAX protease family)
MQMVNEIIKLLNPNTYPKYIKKFLIISFLFSFVLWIFSFILVGNEKLLLNHDILEYEGNLIIFVASIIALIAGLGPFIAYLFVKKESKDVKIIQFCGFGNAFKVFFLFVIISLLISIFGFFDLNLIDINILQLFITLLFFIFISALEEFGWRGIFYPFIVKKSKTFNQSIFVTAIIWGFWHTPIIIIMFLYQGFSFLQIILMFILFIASLYLISYLHAFVNIRTKSILPNVLLHGLFGFWVYFLVFVLKESAIDVVVILAFIITILLLDKFVPSEKLLINNK